jgi:hypothetical protein
VAALFKRSLHLASRAHPCLAVNQEGVQAPMDLAALGTVLAQQGSGSAAAAGRTHLQVFYKLLTDLVGPSLTEQLLGTAWAKHLDGLVEDSLP